MKLKAGDQDSAMRIHSLNQGNGPILLSIDALRSLGAIVDHANDLIVLRRVNPSKIVHVERSATGHQLLPLTENLFEREEEATQPIPSLKDFFACSDGIGTTPL